MFGCYRAESDTWYVYQKGIKYIDKELDLAHVVKAVRGLKRENKSIVLEELDDDKTYLAERDAEREDQPINTEMDILTPKDFKTQDDQFESKIPKSRRFKGNKNYIAQPSTNSSYRRQKMLKPG